MKIYGYSTVMDLTGCDNITFHRVHIEQFLKALCAAIDMEREDLHFWDYEDDLEGYNKAPAHLRGVSAVQFIKTSSIVIHTLDEFGAVFIDLFSCKRYDPNILANMATEWFGGKVRFSQTVARGY